MEKFFQIFHDLHFDISFANALFLMPKFASTIKSLLVNKDKLFELAKVPLNENCSAMLLKKLPEKLGDPEVVQDNSKRSNPTLVSESDFCEDPIVKTSPFRESDFFSKEIENFLKDNSILIENSVFDPEGDILLIEKLLNEDPCQLPPMNLNQAKSLIEEPEYSFSMGYEHFITTLAMKLDEVAESSAKNLVPVPREYEVTSDNESEYNEPIKDDSSAFTTFTNLLFNDKDDFTIHDGDVPIEEPKVYSNLRFDNDEIYSDELELHFLNVESNFVESLSNHDTVKFDHLEEFSRVLMPIHIVKEERIRKEHTEYISLMENDSQREEIDITIDTDKLLPPGFENDDSEGEIFVLEGLRVDNSISNYKNELSDNEASDFDNPSFPRPPPEPPDAEFDFKPDAEEEISVVMNNNDELKCLDPKYEIDVSKNDENDDYFPFMFVIQIFLPYLVYPEVFPFLLSAESEDTIFDPSISV
uniref:Reverse transcriptase domain-containing protein n=1 Tax=Tanacetum cinerariifolium TaxID=118510 RepID=A0A699IWT4_TANCI|nr:reverse transcriptase domain-containing protein [Tanacetum cinerariifolium]